VLYVISRIPKLSGPLRDGKQRDIWSDGNGWFPRADRPQDGYDHGLDVWAILTMLLS
jgi:hypothetical protein